MPLPPPLHADGAHANTDHLSAPQVQAWQHPTIVLFVIGAVPATVRVILALQQGLAAHAHTQPQRFLGGAGRAMQGTSTWPSDLCELVTLLSLGSGWRSLDWHLAAFITRT